MRIYTRHVGAIAVCAFLLMVCSRSNAQRVVQAERSDDFVGSSDTVTVSQSALDRFPEIRIAFDRANHDLRQLENDYQAAFTQATRTLRSTDWKRVVNISQERIQTRDQFISALMDVRAKHWQKVMTHIQEQQIEKHYKDELRTWEEARQKVASNKAILNQIIAVESDLLDGRFPALQWPDHLVSSEAAKAEDGMQRVVKTQRKYRAKAFDALVQEWGGLVAQAQAFVARKDTEGNAAVSILRSLESQLAEKYIALLGINSSATISAEASLQDIIRVKRAEGFARHATVVD